MTVPAVMVQGTGSNVGKSMLVAGLCRVFARRGLRVMPFKPQNMSNNAAVTPDGGEIGRAQAVQALAAGVPRSVHMNPVLLKPETDTGAQVVVQGRAITRAEAADYTALKPRLLSAVLDSFARLEAQADLVIVEGAGSPAEVNLRRGDIANMGFAVAARVPVILAGDIDKGGVIAQIVGTQAVLDAADTAMIRGFLVNKFRGDPRLFDDGYDFIANRTGWRGLGVVPWFVDAVRLPAEDAVDMASTGAGGLRIAVPMLSRIANFDDLDPLKIEAGVTVEMIPPGRALPGDAALVILPGTKSTRGDLAFLRAQGWDVDLAAHIRRGGHVLGLCGGYQMLGRAVHDPEGLDGLPGVSEGLGLLDVETVMRPAKRLTEVAGTCARTGEALTGYEIHIGETAGPDCARPFARVAGRPEGASSGDGRMAGTYLHGAFASDAYRRAFLGRFGGQFGAHFGALGGADYGASVEAALDGLADHLEAHVDCDAVLGIARGRALD